MQAQAKIFVVDDHPLVREWLTALINQQADLHVCGEAEDAPRALKGIEDQRPDVAIVDLSLTRGSGLELIKDLNATCPNVAIVVLSMHDESLYAERALKAGAKGYVTKRETTTKVILAIRDVMAGRLHFSDEIARSIAAKFVTGAAASADSVERLSDRELEVFRLMGQGVETRRIAERLNLSLKTVQAYCARIKEKLSLNNATELLREAVRWEDKQQPT